MLLRDIISGDTWNDLPSNDFVSKFHQDDKVGLKKPKILGVFLISRCQERNKWGQFVSHHVKDVVDIVGSVCILPCQERSWHRGVSLYPTVSRTQVTSWDQFVPHRVKNVVYIVGSVCTPPSQEIVNIVGLVSSTPPRQEHRWHRGMSLYPTVSRT